KNVAGRIFATMGLSGIHASSLTFAAHQIGTHRMGADPSTSVVDPNLRAHDVPNLYLVGSGCFVTASCSPPTLTIAARAARGAEPTAAQRGPGAAAPGALPHAAASNAEAHSS